MDMSVNSKFTPPVFFIGRSGHRTAVLVGDLRCSMESIKQTGNEVLVYWCPDVFSLLHAREWTWLPDQKTGRISLSECFLWLCQSCVPNAWSPAIHWNKRKLFDVFLCSTHCNPCWCWSSLLLLVKCVLFVEYDLLFVLSCWLWLVIVVYWLLCVACPYTLRRNHLSYWSICFILLLWRYLRYYKSSCLAKLQLQLDTVSSVSPPGSDGVYSFCCVFRGVEESPSPCPSARSMPGCLVSQQITGAVPHQAQHAFDVEKTDQVEYRNGGDSGDERFQDFRGWWEMGNLMHSDPRIGWINR